MASTPISGNTGSFLQTTAGNLYTSPVGTQSVITKMTLTNVSTDTIVVDVYLSSTNLASATSPLQTVTVSPLGTTTVQTALQHVIPANGSVLARASVANVIIAKLSVVQFST